ncbi:MAG: hypothetical protein UU43_C0001G0131 [Candidatus Falkowbacteria bacterium GW2011_GWA2_41_14]|uniref:TrbC/VIRB2 family protein n=1 Tax=Candidatus Falkowbacteria bacterium GW2011_GWA2_41_14 TaxID=1618635 RepID=A0A0G0UWP5_9BACT|nr:MAG: hypothetical protein UU43_C0001G0131 [Candidatus Falkowbacteria bacterium GW2011_GWA2_41_14]
MKKILIPTLLLYFLFFSFINSSYAGPAGAGAVEQSNLGTVQLTNPLTGNQKSDDIPVLLGKIINYAMGIIGSLALVMFIYGGLTWMLSGGNEELVKKGKNTVMWAALGIALIFTSYALVRFVIETIGK